MPDELYTPAVASSAAANRHPEASTDAAIKELRQAVEGGCDMPWSMVGISWATAKRLLEVLDKAQ